MTSLFAAHVQRRNMLRSWAAHDAHVFESFSEAVTRLLARPLSDLCVLDLGCGANAPMTVMLHAAGCRVTGADADVGFRWGLGFSPGRLIAYASQAGVLKAVRKAVGELVYDRLYFQQLAAITGLPLTERGLDLRRLDVQNFALPGETFDVVHSNATWEHIADVPAANRAVARVLRPGGLAYIEIHLFPSLSGGHDLPWIVPGRTLLGDVRPWQHLLDPSWRAPVFLNRLRERDYRAAFGAIEDLEIVEWRIEFTEGRELATSGVLALLSGYTVEELTTRSIIVIVRKR